MALAQATLVKSPARAGATARAEARRAGAKGRLALALAEAEKCVLRAPADTTVLKVLVGRGEVVTVNLFCTSAVIPA